MFLILLYRVYKRKQRMTMKKLVDPKKKLTTDKFWVAFTHPEHMDQ